MATFLSILTYLVYALLATFLTAWAVLGIACVRKQRFWPILHTGKATKAFWLAALVLVNPALTVLYLIFGQFRRPDAPSGRIAPVQVGMAVLVLAVAGFFVNFPGLTHFWMVPFVGTDRSAGDDARLDVRLASIESRNSVNSTVSCSSGNYCCLSLRRVAIATESESVLASLIARALRAEIAALPSVEDVQLYAEGRLPPPGSVRPDMFMRVSVRNARVTPIPYAAGLSAQVEVHAGSTAWSGIFTHVDSTDLPTLEFDLDASINHESRTVGYESIRHGLAAKNIAGQIAEALRTKIDAWLREYGPMPELPRSFWGDYRPAELPPPLAAVPSECLGSYCGLFTHNETYLRLQVPADGLAPFLGRVEAGLSAEGWKTIDSRPDTLVMRHDPVRLRIFKAPARREIGWMFTSAAEVDSGTLPVDIIAHYRHRLGDDEKKAAIDGLLASEVPPAALLFTAQLMTPEQRQRMLERLESVPRPSVPVLLKLAETHLSYGRLEEADAAVRRARAALWAVQERDEPMRRIDDVARRITAAVAKKGGKPAPVPAPGDEAPSANDFRSAGFHEVGAGSLPADFEVGLDEPAAFFGITPGGQLRTVALTVRERVDAASVRSYEICCIESSVGGRRSYVTGGQAEAGSWRASVTAMIGLAITVDMAETDRPGRFRISVRTHTLGQ